MEKNERYEELKKFKELFNYEEDNDVLYVARLKNFADGEILSRNLNTEMYEMFKEDVEKCIEVIKESKLKNIEIYSYIVFYEDFNFSVFVSRLNLTTSDLKLLFTKNTRFVGFEHSKLYDLDRDIETNILINIDEIHSKIRDIKRSICNFQRNLDIAKNSLIEVPIPSLFECSKSEAIINLNRKLKFYRDFLYN